MKVELCIPGLHPLALNEQAVALAESLRVDALWAPDHLLGAFHPGLWAEHGWSQMLRDPDAWFDPFCLLAALGRTTSLPLGISVTDGTRRRAVDVARSALSLQQLCRGGFRLGVGSGEAESLIPFGYPYDRPVERFERFLAELRHVLDTGRVPQGGCGRLGLPLESESGRPEVWVAGHGPRMLRLTGQYGDGWIPAWKMTPEQYAEKRELVRKHAEACGRPMPACGLLVSVALGESRRHVLDLYAADPVARTLALWVPAEAWKRHGLEHPAGPHSRGMVDVILHDMDPRTLRSLAERIPAELIEDFSFLGSEDEVFGALEPYARAGVEHLVLANSTGIAGGVAEILARGPDFARLVARLAAL